MQRSLLHSVCFTSGKNGPRPPVLCRVPAIFRTPPSAGHVQALVAVRLEPSASSTAALIQKQGQSLTVATSTGVAEWAGLQVSGTPGRHTLVFTALPAAASSALGVGGAQRAMVAANSADAGGGVDESMFPVRAVSASLNAAV